MGVNEAAMVATVAVLRAAGRLENVDEALVAAALSLARAVDEHPSNASLWREYRAFEVRLRTVGEGASDLDALLARLSAPVGHTEDGEPSDAR
jgi:hypothetical protein